MIRWKASMSVGVEEIDSQHQEIIRRAGQYLESLADRSRQDTGILLSYLRNYCVTHFGAEEAWMRQTGYPGLAEHQQEHDAFIKRLLRLSAEHEQARGPGLEPAQLGEFVESWLISHVAACDLQLARHLRVHGLPAPPEQGSPPRQPPPGP